VMDPVQYFQTWFTLCPIGALPDPTVNEREELKTYHAPIYNYKNNSYMSLAIWCDDYRRVCQYDGPSDSHILVDGGLYKGSCGGPYVNHDGNVVAMHLASMHEGVNLSQINTKRRKTKDRVDELESFSSQSYEIHTSIREGLVLSKIPTITNFIASQLIITTP